MNSFTSSTNFFSLSHPVEDGMQTFPVPWHKPVVFEELGRLETEGRRSNHIHIGTHSGTHFDAPSHFIQEGKTISDFEVKTFISDATMLSLEADSFEEIGPDSIYRSLESDSIPENSAIVLRFGWGKMYGKNNYYSDQPFLNEAAMRLMLELNPKIIGYDVAMPDNPNNGFGSECDSPMHKLALGQDVLLLENMMIPLDTPPNFTLLALPLELTKLDGSPARVIGISL